MRDPHVVSLTFNVRPGPTVSYRDPPALEFHRSGFRGKLDEGKLVLEPDDHYPTIPLARQAAERFLRAWEVEGDLRSGALQIQFDFEDGELIDRNPPGPGESQVLLSEFTAVAVSAGSASLHQTNRKYPDPPELFRFNDDVEVLWFRLEEYRSGREPLLSMAYFCLSWLERLGSGRPGAAVLFGIDKKVLDKLGDLTSNRGTPDTARKATRAGKPQELTAREERWIVATIKQMILRVGEAPGSVKAQLTLRDLPPL